MALKFEIWKQIAKNWSIGLLYEFIPGGVYMNINPNHKKNDSRITEPIPLRTTITIDIVSTSAGSPSSSSVEPKIYKNTNYSSQYKAT